ncbi:hypothetical protein N0V93_009874 [Gnomoniopsis smithogilvyi]|uniref:Mitochondrial carrier protein n=1 Tax=Gnomoniopsis smithogilvyi TaxID=1191159 RepID=A0A9W8YIY4_9PEZI|nr:hypothetical protein N0V93_009874 [Gnomoniopsis smithogilvyi]
MSNSNADIVLAGAAAAFTIDLLIYPLDTIKTRYQSRDYVKTFAQSGAAKQSSSTSFRGLYQGVGSVIVATLPAAGIFFTTYEATKVFYAGLLSRVPLPDGLTVPTPVIHSLASGTAELASCLVLTPAEVIKQNAQMIRSNPTSSTNGGWKNSTSVQALRMVSQGAGASGAAHRMLTGYSALVARNLPFTAMQFPIFEAVRKFLWDRRDRKSDSTVKDGSGGVGGGERKIEKGAVTRGLLETGKVNGISAAVSGAISAVITTPMDVVKTRLMLSAGEERKMKAGEANKEPRAQGQKGSSPKPKSMSGAQVARLVYQENGIKGLFRGGLLRAVWTAIGSGLYLSTYEVAKVWLKGTTEETDHGDGQ